MELSFAPPEIRLARRNNCPGDGGVVALVRGALLPPARRRLALEPGSEPEQFLPGVTWYQPTITPDGRHLAYLAEGGMYLVDLASDPIPRLIRSEGVQPVFLNSTQLWFLAPAPGGCAAFPDAPMVYNIGDSSVAPSVIDQVYGVWPATSSNH